MKLHSPVLNLFISLQLEVSLSWQLGQVRVLNFQLTIELVEVIEPLL